ncbi:MAG: 50S ribosomal protein L3 [Candidatus Curtissbacteria bacterium]
MEAQNITTIIGQKGVMSMRFNSRGQQIPVTAIIASPNVIFINKSGKQELTFGQRKKAKKPQNAYVKSLGFAPQKIKEIQTTQEIKTGDKISIAIFSPGDAVKVTGTSKGKGFAGGMKRWGFHGGPKTHGQSDRHRSPGSIGQTTTPGRVFRGKKMAGHMGNVTKTVRGLEVVEIDEQKNILIVKGSVPGATNSLLIIEKIGRIKKYIEPPKEKEDDEEKEEKKVDSKDDQSAGGSKPQSKDEPKEEAQSKEQKGES